MRHPKYKSAGIVSRGILRLANLPSFLPEVETVIDLSSIRRRIRIHGKIDSLIGWGCKPTATRARKLAAAHRLPYLALEDGFLRSVGLGVNGAPPLSLVFDDIGIYYDATRPSKLEKLIEEGVFTNNPGLIDRTESILKEYRRLGLSKYNTGRQADLASLGIPRGRRVLVVDQCRGDVSVPLSLTDGTLFSSMLSVARDEHPGARFLVKTHPDVLAGKRNGFLGRILPGNDVTLLTEDIAPQSLLSQVDAVYTVSSLLGMEALIAGKEVRCFGLPFYAGWGATRDEVSCERRTRKCSVTEIFAAAYLLYPRYVNPYTGENWEIEDAIDFIGWLKQEYAKRPQNAVCMGIPRWKRSHVRPFLQTPFNSVTFKRSSNFVSGKGGCNGGDLILWAAREPAEFANDVASAGARLIRLEDGFIRSCGLGSDLIPAASLVMDFSGMHFRYRDPSDLETLLEHHDFTPKLLAMASDIRRRIVMHGINKYNSEYKPVAIGQWPKTRKRILVPGQVDSDAAIFWGTSEIDSNEKLLETIRRHHPDAFIIYKPHPDIASGNRKSGLSPAKAEKLADLVLVDVPLSKLFPHVDEIHTLTSLAGFEALLANKAVVTYGGPFYAGWGLTRDALAFHRRTRRLTLDELVAGTLLIYPMYFDWKTQLPCGLEIVLTRILEQRAEKLKQLARHNILDTVRVNFLTRIQNGISGWMKGFSL